MRRGLACVGPAVCSMTFVAVATAQSPVQTQTVAGQEVVVVSGTAGNDTITLSMQSGNIRVVVQNSDGSRSATIDATTANARPILIRAGAGDDIVNTGAVTIGVALEVWLGDGNDQFVGGMLPETIYGGDGNDVIDGDAGNDVIDAGPGFADRLYGEDGDDILLDEDGTNECWGGDGNDTIVVVLAPTWDNDGNPNNGRRYNSLLIGGRGTDIATVVNAGSTTVNLTTNGDDPSSPGVNSTNDRLRHFGVFTLGSQTGWEAVNSGNLADYQP